MLTLFLTYNTYNTIVDQIDVNRSYYMSIYIYFGWMID